MEPLFEKATRQHTKNHNSRFVLRTIYDEGEISRAELARRTELTRTTVSEVVANLIDQGLVEEIGHGPSLRGRSPILLKVVEDSRHIIGVNLANGSMHGTVINLRGEIRQRVSKPFPSRDGDVVLKLLYAVVDELIASTGRPLIGIGISSPGLIDPTIGIVRNAVNLGWQELPLRQILQARYNLPVHLANDSQALALGEYTFGQHRAGPNLVVIKVGDGIGSGIVLNGRLFHGDGYGAGEIGHVVVAENGRQCRCGNVGCLETVAGKYGIIRRVQEGAWANPSSLLHQLAPDQDRITLDTVLQAFEAGDQTARQVIQETGRYLGVAVANVVGILNVQRILLTGWVASFGEVLRDAVMQGMRTRSLPLLSEQTTIELVPDNGDMALLGASAQLLMSELEFATLARGRLAEPVLQELAGRFV
jgi:N-acetylglucosamine repressor